LNISEILPRYSIFRQELEFQYFVKNENIGCNFTTNFFGGGEIAQEGGEILPKVSQKL